ncbi:unnamed protein product [Diplocarpon coronariae]|uniref:Cytochrome P n=1 Tax=Diplocarpon coronariae TaxID=2795749 RepID=A0A218YTK7_9HELO|nr:cytochrome P [Marssonina coronariae]
MAVEFCVSAASPRPRASYDWLTALNPSPSLASLNLCKKSELEGDSRPVYSAAMTGGAESRSQPTTELKDRRTDMEDENQEKYPG